MFNGVVIGGDAFGDATENTVNITVGTFNCEVYGGYAVDDATGNTVTISGGTVSSTVYGGCADGSGSATGNTVNISDGTFNGDVFGGYSTGSGAAEKNTVTISDGTFSYTDIFGGYSDSGYAKHNEVVISGVKESSTFDTIYGGIAGGDAENNRVTLGAGNATYESSIYGGYSDSGNATGNIVTISGGTFTSYVYGGRSTDGNVTGNTVNISGGTFTSYVYGGYSFDRDATGNTVNISGDANLKDANLYGGYGYDSGVSEYVVKYGGADTPNTLNIGVDDELQSQLDAKGITVAVGAWNNKKVKSIAGFDVINFNYINWSNGGNVVETEGLELNNTTVGKVVIGSGTVKNGEWMNLISATNPVTDNFENQTNRDITIRTGLATYETIKGDIVLDGNNIKLTITNDTSSGAISVAPSGAEYFIQEIKEVDSSAYKAIEAVTAAAGTEKEKKAALTNMLQLGEAGGQSATAATIARNVSDATVSRMSVGGGGGHHHRGGHGPADFNEKDGSAVWAQYVHGKDKVDGMALADGVTTSYESQFNGVVLGVDFKEVGKYQSGIAFNYGEGDSHTKNIALSRSDYDFWGIGYYGAVKNADSNVIFDINYAKSDSEVKQQFKGGVELEAEPETTTISAGVKVEKLIDKGAMQFVPYAGLRFMSVDTDEYSANYLGKEAFNYSADRQNIWLLPVGVSFRQENVYDGGWVVTPKVDLSYIWAFGDTENEMTVRTPDVAEAARLGYTVMNDGSFLGSIGLEAEKGDWTFGVAYSYQKSSDSRSDRWYVDAKYSF